MIYIPIHYDCFAIAIDSCACEQRCCTRGIAPSAYMESRAIVNPDIDRGTKISSNIGIRSTSQIVTAARRTFIVERDIYRGTQSMYRPASQVA
ncbi:MAG: hypothetical protein MUC48_19180 [Leptolyngbya sp. Prado105]|nr:hypothetical protein [Leptolyngbya sp. Prado105]